MTNHLFELKDKRTLGYSIYGPGDGTPVLYFHGTPSSRLEPLLLNCYNVHLDELLFKYHLQLIAIDRPGMGNSSFNPNGTFASFANDTAELLSELKVQRAKVLCWSGGGTFALSMAYHYPNLIDNVFIITGFTKSFSDENVFKNMNGNVYYFLAAKYVPSLLRTILNWTGRKKATKPIPQWLSKLPDVDHKLMKDSKTIQYFTEVTMNEACKTNSKGIVYEAALYFKDTGYQIKDIVQPVHYWYGLEDNTVAIIHAKSIEESVQKGCMHYKPHEGHLSIFIHYFEEVLVTIAAS